MLELKIPEQEFYDERTEEFVYVKSQVLSLEHSLVSISKWEAKWHKPFLGKDSKTSDELLDYIRCMTVTRNVPTEVYYALTQENLNAIRDYIDDPSTATTFGKDKEKPSNKKITSEVIYYWMTALNIPWECQKWHLNRLLTLIRVCNEKNKPSKGQKLPRTPDGLSKQHSLNKARRAASGSKG